jgi:hypothetical protein
MTEHYSHLDAGEKEAAAEEVARLVLGPDTAPRGGSEEPRAALLN